MLPPPQTQGVIYPTWVQNTLVTFHTGKMHPKPAGVTMGCCMLAHAGSLSFQCPPQPPTDPWPPNPAQPWLNSGCGVPSTSLGLELLELKISLNCGIHFTPSFAVCWCLKGVVSLPSRGRDASPFPRLAHSRRTENASGGPPRLCSCWSLCLVCPLPFSHVRLLFAEAPTKRPVLLGEKKAPFMRCVLHRLVLRNELGTQAKVLRLGISLPSAVLMRAMSLTSPSLCQMGVITVPAEPGGWGD